MISLVKRVVITGGTGGLGSVMSEKFRGAGWEVKALGRADLDLLDEERVREYFSENACELLICAAGMIRDQPLKRMEEETWDEVFGINFEGARICAEVAISEMVKRKGGHVVFVSSYAAIRPAVGQAAYAAAKAALLGLTKALAEKWGKEGVRVNAVLPGFLETPMTEAVSEKRKAVVRDLHFLGEFNTVESAANFFLFLEEGMRGASGQVFQLDSRP
ncbi:MAG: SDR family oxidoreductase [Akkermansiaceae bacterium]